MRSVRLHAVGDLQFHDGPVPVAGEGEKLIRVKAARPNVVFEAFDAAPASVGGPGGDVILAGIPNNDRTSLKASQAAARRKGLKVMIENHGRWI